MMKGKFLFFREQAYRLREKNDFDELINFFAQHEKELLPIDLLLLKAASIQLADDISTYSLEDVEKFLNQATDLDPGGLQSRVELGYFYYAVMDRAADALPLFDFVIKQGMLYSVDAICGKAKVLEELQGIDAAITYLEQSVLSQADPIQELLHELLIAKQV